MSFPSPDDATEILYGSSGDVRNEINAFMPNTTNGHYADETELPGALIVGSLRKATRQINVFLEPVYPDQIPFAAAASVPRFLEEVANDLAVYYVWRSIYVKLGNIPDEKKAEYYDVYTNSKDGILTQLKDGRMKLAELAGQTPDDTKSVRESGRHPIFDVNDEKNQDIDSNLSNDIDRERQT